MIPDVKAVPGSPKETAKWQDQRLIAESDPQDPWQPSLLRPNYAYLKSLPSDPDALAAMVRQTCASLGGGCNLGGFEIISHVLADAVVPAEVRSGLLKAAKRIEGITLRKNVQLAATGEHGIAIAYTNTKGEGSGYRYELVFDGGTYEILGTQRVDVNGWTPPKEALVREGKVAHGGLSEGKSLTVKPHDEGKRHTIRPEPVAPGTVVKSTAIIDKGIVEKIGQQP